MGERERVGGRDGLLATQMISLSSLSFSFSRCVCAYISEREREREDDDKERQREREIDARKQFFIWTFAPRTLSKYISLSPLSSIFLFFCFFRQRLPSFFLPKRAHKKRRGGGGGLSTFFSLCEIKPFVSFIVPLLLRIRIRVQNTTPTMLGRLTEWLATSAKCEEAPDKVPHENLGREKRERERELVF